MLVFDDSGVSGRRGMAGMAVLVLVSVAAAAVWWWQPTPPHKPDPAAAGEAVLDTSGEASSYTCAVVSIDGSQDPGALEICRRQAVDAAQRQPVVPSRAVMDPTAMRIYEAMFRAICHTDTGFTCGQPRPAADADVKLVRGVLHDLGFSDVTVRLSRPDDPAPDGSVVYAVRLQDDTCIVAFAKMGSGPNMNGVTGLLPNGECLKTY